MDSATERKNRSKLFYRIIISLSLIALLAIVWALRSMIVPVIVGALLAYSCQPILRILRQKGLPNGLAILLLLGTFITGIYFVTEQVRDIIPDEDGKLILRVRMQYKLQKKYNTFLGGEKSFISETISKEIDPVFNDLIGILSLDKNERLRFLKYLRTNREQQPLLERYYKYHLMNRDRQKRIKEIEQTTPPGAKSEGGASETGDGQSNILAQISDIISIWLVAPFVFLFLLVDNGEIKKSMITLVPNRYFEMVLTIIDNVDDAIGNYLRGTILECSLVGISFVVCLFLIGIEWQWALIIGLIAGAANAIPFLGPAIGLVVGIFYALIAEDMQPMLFFVDPENIIIWVLISVGIVQALDNTVFQPIVLGSAVSLHPLVVIFGVMGGSIIFGFAGMLFAIPTIVIVKVVLSTLLRELKAYNLIE